MKKKDSREKKRFKNVRRVEKEGNLKHMEIWEGLGVMLGKGEFTNEKINQDAVVGKGKRVLKKREPLK